MALSGASLRFFLPQAVFFLLFAALPLWPQSGEEEPAGASCIGLTLTELLGSLGPPKSVFPVRGLEEWQDDVVFSYDQADMYILKDRVWQAGFKSVMGIKAGDNAAMVSLILGYTASVRLAESRQNSVFYFLDGKSWPMMLRCDFDKDGKVTAIFIFRSDL